VSVLIDSNIWFLALRRKTASGLEVAVWTDLVDRGLAQLIGPVRQEVLSGIRERKHFELMRERMRAFPDLPLMQLHYERAAEFSNICRTHGIQGSSTDFLLCAVSDLEKLAIFTTDGDFTHFAKWLPIRLFAAHN
jgi:hypothetical protein